MDTKIAFLSEELDDEIYIDKICKVCHIKYYIYGIKQSIRQQYFIFIKLLFLLVLKCQKKCWESLDCSIPNPILLRVDANYPQGSLTSESNMHIKNFQIQSIKFQLIYGCFQINFNLMKKLHGHRRSHKPKGLPL